MTRIIGISGRKQSGKNTSANYLHGLVLSEKRPPNNESLINDFRIEDNGSLWINTSNQNGQVGWGEFDVSRKDMEFVAYAEREMWPLVKLYSFADSLKFMAVDMFNIEPRQVWGTDEDKNELIHLKWEDMPGVWTTTDDETFLMYDGLKYTKHAPGYMTAREFLQYFGTEVMRKIYTPVWVENTLKRIYEEQTQLAIICDVRFPDEVDGILDVGGEVIRLTRSPENDTHESELALDPDKYDHNKFTHIVDNEAIGIDGLCEILKSVYNKGV